MKLDGLGNRIRKKIRQQPRQETQKADLGLGDKVARNPGTRLLQAEGNFNVIRRGGAQFSTYQRLVEMHWFSFLLLVFMSYVGINLIFGIGFTLIGLEQLNGLVPDERLWRRITQGFFFSVETFTTVGYGTVSPASFSASLLASVTALSGLLSVALATGLVFARFSRPQSLIRYSQNAIVGPYLEDGTGLQFRIVNQRDTNLINLKANVVLSWLEQEEEKEEGYQRRFAPLRLERDFVALFPLNWTIVHPITEDSPISGWSKEDFRRRNCEILVMIEGYHQTYAQIIHINSSYTYDEILWNARFLPMYREESSQTVLHLDLLDETESIK